MDYILQRAFGVLTVLLTILFITVAIVKMYESMKVHATRQTRIA